MTDPQNKLLKSLFPPDVNWSDLKSKLISRGKLLPHEWLRVRGVGPFTLKKLDKEGLVELSGDGSFECASTRLANCLRSVGYRTIEQTRSDVESGVLTKNSRIRNYGVKCHCELLELLGITSEIDVDAKGESFHPTMANP